VTVTTPTRSDTLAAAMQTLRVDAATAEVVRALTGDHVRSVLLKGPGSQRWLYDDGLRPYFDTDLIVPPEDFPKAEAVLARLGFTHCYAGWAFGEAAEHSEDWERKEPPAWVDLHRTLTGVRADPERVWEVLFAETEPLVVAGTEIRTPTEPARAFIAALHAAKHVTDRPKALEDLRRAIERCDAAVWEQAAEFASALDAVSAFSFGLRLFPDGVEVARTLGLSGDVDAETLLRADDAPSLAMALARFTATPGVLRKLSFLARKVIPTPARMRRLFPLARRGWPGLAVAYVWRLVALVPTAGPSLRAWWKARKRSSQRRTTSR
jgi:Uncharacterised nucleotidyltransferase